MCKVYIIGQPKNRIKAAQRAFEISKITGQTVVYVRRPKTNRTHQNTTNPGGAAA